MAALSGRARGRAGREWLNGVVMNTQLGQAASRLDPRTEAGSGLKPGAGELVTSGV